MTQARILVVEDDNGLREALVDTLLLGGYECREADSGERALLALSRQPFDMVISDIQMGGWTASPCWPPFASNIRRYLCC